MLTLSTRVIFHNEATGQGVVNVQSSRCWYRVALHEDTITLLGPGVEETYSWDDVPEELSFEAKAIYVALHFEESR